MRFILKLLVIALVLLSAQFAGAYSVSCNDVWVDVEDITIESDDREAYFFKIYNDSDEDFDVFQANAWKESGRYQISVVDYGSVVQENSYDWITVGVESDRVSSDSTGRSYIELRGQFDNGDYCSFGNIGKFYFGVTVEKATNGGDAGCDGIEIRASNVYVDESSRKIVSFKILNDTDEDFDLQGLEAGETSSYFDAEAYRVPGEIQAGESETFKLIIDSESVSADRQGTVTIKARGRFEGGEYCSFSEIAEERFTVYVENVSGTGPSPSFPECDDVYLNASTVRVDRGTTAYATIYLENGTGQDFLIDYVSVFDSSSSIQAEENGYEKRIPAFGNSYVNVKVKAYSYAETGEEEAFVEARGHFQGESTCYLFDDEIAVFPVIVEEPTTFEPEPVPSISGDCSKFSLIVPSVTTIGNTGSIPITIDNRTIERATVRIYGPGLTVQPLLISIPKNTLVSENIGISSALPETTIVYKIEALGCSQTKTGRVVAAGIEPEPEKPEPEEPAGQADVLDSLASGFFAVGQAAAILGFLVLVVLTLYLIFKPKSA